MRVLLIVNPTATGVREPVLDALVAQLERVGELEVVETERAGHAMDLAREAESGVVVGVGGDGTANELANGVRKGVTLGVVPAGASSVFARHLGFPRDTVAAGGMVAEAIRRESTKLVGLGLADERRFTFAAGLGLDAEATAAIDRIREEREKRDRPGDFKVLQAAVHILREEGFALHERMTIATGKGSFHRASYVAVANQHPYTFFGRVPVQVAPRADFEHGLDVVFARELRRRDMWRLPVYALLWPRHAKHGSRRIGYLHDMDDFTVACDVPTAIQIDGEYLGHVERVHFRYERDAVRVLVPPGES
ncbi:MAG TPA: diacylglycerol kinase family protein [Gaiellales bacterium]|jgi:diacylglycerol kinase family enzyme|nr:diacylglycerol kinase family protein [Gaiellales bacterium]